MVKTGTSPLSFYDILLEKMTFSEGNTPSTEGTTQPKTDGSREKHPIFPLEFELSLHSPEILFKPKHAHPSLHVYGTAATNLARKRPEGRSHSAPPEPQHLVSKLSSAAQLALLSLGLAKSTSDTIRASEVKKAYRAKAREHHPDRCTNSGEQFLEYKELYDLVAQELKALNQA
jgi:hypothetical protein